MTPTPTLPRLEATGEAAVPADLIAEAITEAFGERCPEFEPTCHCCRAWKQYDDLRRAPIDERRRARDTERERCKKIALDYPLTDVCSDHANMAVAFNASQNIAAIIDGQITAHIVVADAQEQA